MGPRFPDICTSWCWVVSSMPRPLFPPGKQPPGTHWIGDWIDLGTGLVQTENWKFLTLPGLSKLQFSISVFKLIIYFLSQRKFRVSVESETSIPKIYKYKQRYHKLPFCPPYFAVYTSTNPTFNWYGPNAWCPFRSLCWWRLHIYIYIYVCVCVCVNDTATDSHCEITGSASMTMRRQNCVSCRLSLRSYNDSLTATRPLVREDATKYQTATV
jgi:hypothetical protein